MPYCDVMFIDAQWIVDQHQGKISLESETGMG
jgi:hypothetical protein